MQHGYKIKIQTNWEGQGKRIILVFLQLKSRCNCVSRYLFPISDTQINYFPSGFAFVGSGRPNPHDFRFFIHSKGSQAGINQMKDHVFNWCYNVNIESQTYSIAFIQIMDNNTAFPMVWIMAPSYSYPYTYMMPPQHPHPPQSYCLPPHYNMVECEAPQPQIQKINENPGPEAQLKEEADPPVQPEEESNYSVPAGDSNKQMEQKSGRNSASNILRSFTKFLKMPHFKEAFDKVAKLVEKNISFKQFLSWANGIGLSSHRYIRIKRVIRGVKSKPLNGRILTLLFNVFMENHSRAMVLTSVKTQKKNISPTLRQVRKIRNTLELTVREGLNKISGQ